MKFHFTAGGIWASSFKTLLRKAPHLQESDTSSAARGLTSAILNQPPPQTSLMTFIYLFFKENANFASKFLFRKTKKRLISFATEWSAAQRSVPSNLIPCKPTKSLQPGCSSRQQQHNEASGQRGSKHVYKHVPFFMLRSQRSHSRQSEAGGGVPMH